MSDEQLLEVLADLRDQVEALRDELQLVRPLDRPRPVRGLREAARVLGVGRTMIGKTIAGLPLHRRPATYGDHASAWWESEEACRAWWHALHQAPAPKPRAPSRRGPTIVDVVDDDAITRALRLRA